MVEGRAKKAFKDWLEAQTPAFRNGIEVVAMDVFTGFKTATADAVFADERHCGVEATWNWNVHQRLATAYRIPSAKPYLAKVITSISHGVPNDLPELTALGCTLKRRKGDVLASFDRPGTSITRALLDTGGFRPRSASTGKWIIGLIGV
jgi:transposase